MIVPTLALLLAAAPQTAVEGARSAPRASAPISAMSRVKLVATGHYSDGDSEIVQVVTDRDSDGDGKPESYDVRVTCDGGALHTIVSPRDAASGLPTGKRMHKPFVITMELGKTMAVDDWAESVKGRAVADWDVVTMKGGRGAAPAVATYDLKACKKV